jgi:enterochelin esterase-like enzyme
MKFVGFLVTFALLATAPAAAQTSDDSANTLQPVHVSAGRIVDLGIVQSKYADPRRVVVWLPSDYKPEGQKYSVLYMHDGRISSTRRPPATARSGRSMSTSTV